MQEKQNFYCPICKKNQEIVRIVQTEIETKPFSMHTPMGKVLEEWVSETSQPTAYCPDCKMVFYIGPSPEEIRSALGEKRKKRLQVAQELQSKIMNDPFKDKPFF